jgi:hypothetical protein
MDELPEIETQLTMEELDKFLIELAESRVGIRRKLIALKNKLEVWGVITKK